MPGILPTMMTPGLMPLGIPRLSWQLLLVVAGANVAALAVAGYRANRRAAASMRASRSFAMAQRVAALMHVGVEDLGPLLGLGRTAVARWSTGGVPARHQPAVAELLRAAVALRQRFPAPVARRLLAVRVEHGVAVEDARRQLADLSRVSRQGHISVRSR